MSWGLLLFPVYLSTKHLWDPSSRSGRSKSGGCRVYLHKWAHCSIYIRDSGTDEVPPKSFLHLLLFEATLSEVYFVAWEFGFWAREAVCAAVKHYLQADELWARMIQMLESLWSNGIKLVSLKPCPAASVYFLSHLCTSISSFFYFQLVFQFPASNTYIYQHCLFLSNDSNYSQELTTPWWKNCPCWCFSS